MLHLGPWRDCQTLVVVCDDLGVFFPMGLWVINTYPQWFIYIYISYNIYIYYVSIYIPDGCMGFLNHQQCELLLLVSFFCAFGSGKKRKTKSDMTFTDRILTLALFYSYITGWHIPLHKAKVARVLVTTHLQKWKNREVRTLPLKVSSGTKELLSANPWFSGSVWLQGGTSKC